MKDKTNDSEKFYARFIPKPHMTRKQHQQAIWMDDEDDDEDESEEDYEIIEDDDVLLQQTESERSSSVKKARPYPVSRPVEARCPVAKKCSGCQMQNLSYQDGLRWKQAQVVRLLGQYGRVQPIIGMDQPTHYRNKVQVAFGMTRQHKIISGVWQSKEHRITVVDRCMIEDSVASEIAITVRKLLAAFKMTAWTETEGGFLRHLLIRRGFATGQIMVILVAGTPVFPSKKNFVSALLRAHPEITTVIFTVNNSETNLLLGAREEVLYGSGYIEDVLCGLTFRISAKSFYQVNPVQTEVLYRTAIDFAGLTGQETVLDAYCGIGTIGLAASSAARRVIGVELNPDAVADAQKNKRENGIQNAAFVCADAGEYMTGLAGQLDSQKVDVLFIDPPRAGASREFLDAVLRCMPKKIVYISCNPETQARDLKLLAAGRHPAYQVRRIQPVDMFPWTHHVENIVLLERTEDKREAELKHHTGSAAEPKKVEPKARHTRPSRRSQFADRNRAVFGKSGKKTGKSSVKK